MKQAIDNKTIDMFGNEPKPTMYRFYIETTEGTEVEWTGLTKKQARDMYAYTDAHHPSNATGYGWEEMK
jgi:hypothetical protein